MRRNITLDYFKLFFSFLVVIIHNPIFWENEIISNLIINGLCRIAVPCFFVINGLYLTKVISKPEYLKKYVKKLLLFYSIWMLIYSPFYLFSFKDNLTNSILLNVSNIIFGFWHLWYIIALIGGVLLLYFLKKRNFSNMKLLKISCTLFIIGWSFSKFELFYPNHPGLLGYIIRSSFPTRNFLFIGFPFITLGYLISQESFLDKLKSHIKRYSMISTFLLFLALESMIHFYFVGRRGFDFYLILIVLCPAIIIKILDNSRVTNVETDFISKLSSSIYFIHPLVLFFVQNLFPDLIGTQHYILILFFSIILGSSLVQANKELKVFF